MEYKKYETDDGCTFDSCMDALMYVLEESKRTTSCGGGITEFTEYYY